MRVTEQTDRQRGGAGAGAHTHTGFVYFIEAVGCNAIKIGFSRNPERRMADMQTDCPARLQLLAIKEGTRRLESQVHQAFANLHLRGEWYRGDETLDRYILRLTGLLDSGRWKILKGVHQ